MAKTSFALFLFFVASHAFAEYPACSVMVGQMIITDPPPPPHKDIGGVILFKPNFSNARTPQDVQAIVNRYTNPPGGIPRFVSVDNEGGKVQRLMSDQGFTDIGSAYSMQQPAMTMKYLDPDGDGKDAQGRPIDLSKIDPKAFTFESSQQMAAELSRKENLNAAGAGINQNMAPVADLCVPGAYIRELERCYAANPDRVADHVFMSASAQMFYDILPTIKHFPGHGSASDSHQNTAIVNKTYEQIWAEDVAVYANALPRIVKEDLLQQEQWNKWRRENGRPEKPVVNRYPAVMVGHLTFPNIPLAKDARGQQLPSSLNPDIVTGWLREKLGHKGLIVTDDIGQMAAATSGRTHLETAILAIKAGNDQLILKNDYPNRKPFGDERSQEKFMTDVCRAADQDPRMLQNIKDSWDRILENKRAYGVMQDNRVEPEQTRLTEDQLAAAAAELGANEEPVVETDPAGNIEGEKANK